MATRNNARKICKTQLTMGKKILRTKTRKAAIGILKKVPHMRSGNFNSGLKWWDYIQSVPEKDRAATIKMAAKPMMEACINKYSSNM